MKIVKAHPSDAAQIYCLGKAAFTGGENWTESQFYQAADAPNSILLVAMQQNVVIGFLQCDLVLDDMHLNLIAVDKKYQGQKVAWQLLTQAVQLAKQKGGKVFSLEVRSQNRPANALYQKFGFAAVGARKRFYHDPADDAVVYIKEI